ncbi:MAG TPA: hypothetical protein VIP28_15390 [Nocardioides sp.]
MTTKTAAAATLPRTHYSAHEVAEMVGLTYQQVLALTKTGGIPVKRFGRYIRIPASWVRQELDAV